MSALLKNYRIENFVTSQGKEIKELMLTYEVFGCELFAAPIVLVNHALTGNSDLISEKKGWWKTIIGEDKLIDTKRYTVIAFNIPGNTYDGTFVEDYQNYTTRDIAQLFIDGLKGIGITELYAAIGGSLGGALAWEMAVLEPEMIKYVIPIATYWQTSDWILGYHYTQMQILETCDQPMKIARMMAMLFYRTPQSLQLKFNRTKTEDGSMFNVASWLKHHGEKLNDRFEITAYRLMTHLTTTHDICRGRGSFEAAVKPIKSTIVQIAVDTDWLYAREETFKTSQRLTALKISNQYHEIKSIHGHDAFLIEFEQLISFLKPIFN